jgi:prepilin-type N-terminal cleavage/methylation domain-containing protein
MLKHTFKNNQHSKKAFTLIELLIVIAIIGILFIVLVSKVDFATDKAKVTGVQTDFRSFQLAFDTVAREQQGFSSLVNGDDYSKLVNAINKNLDNKLKIAIDDGVISMRNDAKDPWGIEYHGQYVTGNDGKDRGAIIMYSNGENMMFGSEANVSGGVVSIVSYNAGKDDYSVCVVYSLINGTGSIAASTTGFENNIDLENTVTGEDNGGENQFPDQDGDEIIDKEPTFDAAGLYTEEGVMLFAWQELITEGYVKVLNDTYISDSQPDILVGVLVISDDITQIGNYAFEECVGLKRVIMPNSIMKINMYAFENCTGLNELIIPDSVATIEKNAFYNCNSIINILIGTGVENIGDSAFYNCKSVQRLTIGKNVKTIDKYAFYNCVKLEEIYFNATQMNNLAWNGYVFYGAGNNSKGINVKIDRNVTKIPNNLFYANVYPKITNVIFEENSLCNSIGEYAFYGCKSLVDIAIPEGVTSIGASAFYHCIALTSIVIPDSVTNIGNYAFAGNFDYRMKLVNVVLSENIDFTSIGDGVFSYCNSLKSIKIPTNVTSIGKESFKYCESLTSIEIPNSLVDIGYGAFNHCTNLVDITIPHSVTNIDAYAFGSCKSLLSVVLPDRITIINDGLFESCTSLNNIVIPDGVTSIGKHSFGGCKSLTSINLPNSVLEIKDEAFWQCLNIISMEFGNSIKTIGYQAFYYCTSLASITLPDSVTSIGSMAFYSCRNLASITFGKNITQLGGETFAWCTSLTSIVIPNSVEKIFDAFYCCTSLTNIVFDGTIEEWNDIGKYDDWNKSVPASKVICNDGNASVK